MRRPGVHSHAIPTPATRGEPAARGFALTMQFLLEFTNETPTAVAIDVDGHWPAKFPRRDSQWTPTAPP